MTKFRFILTGVALVAASTLMAQGPKTVVDYHTTVERLFGLEKGMTLIQVNQALNSEPHDLLQNTKGGYMMLEYRYLKAYRKVAASEVDTESGRILGTPQYRDAASAYLLFDNNHTLVSWVTADAMGDLRHQYKLEATATRLGSMNAPCTRNCRIAMPTESCSAEVEEAPVAAEEPEEKASPVSNLFGGLRNKLETMTNAGEDPADATDSAPSSVSGDTGYVVGDKVWIAMNGVDAKGVVSKVESASLEVRYVDPEGGVNKDFFRFEEVRGRE